MLVASCPRSCSRSASSCLASRWELCRPASRPCSWWAAILRLRVAALRRLRVLDSFLQLAWLCTSLAAAADSCTKMQSAQRWFCAWWGCMDLGALAEAAQELRHSCCNFVPVVGPHEACCGIRLKSFVAALHAAGMAGTCQHTTFRNHSFMCRFQPDAFMV